MPRPRKTLADAKRDGSYDHNPGRFLGRAEPVTKPLGPAPMHFTPEQIEIWEELVAVVPAGVLAAGDTYLVELAVVLIGELRSGYLSAPRMGHLRCTLGSMGLTPADRTRVNGSNEPPKKEEDKLGRLLGGKPLRPGQPAGTGVRPN